MTPERNWFPIFIRFAAGAFIGFLLCALLATVAAVTVPGPVVAEFGAMILFGMLAIIAGFGLLLAGIEMSAQGERYRSATGRCEHCGYTLRGVRTTSEQCPECGEPFRDI